MTGSSYVGTAMYVRKLAGHLHAIIHAIRPCKYANRPRPLTGPGRRAPLSPVAVRLASLCAVVCRARLELSRLCRGSVEPLSRPLSRPCLSSLVEPVETCRVPVEPSDEADSMRRRVELRPIDTTPNP